MSRLSSRELEYFVLGVKDAEGRNRRVKVKAVSQAAALEKAQARGYVVLKVNGAVVPTTRTSPGTSKRPIKNERKRRQTSGEPASARQPDPEGPRVEGPRVTGSKKRLIAASRKPSVAGTSRPVLSALIICLGMGGIGFGLLALAWSGVDLPNPLKLWSVLFAVGSVFGLLGLTLFGATEVISHATRGWITPVQASIAASVAFGVVGVLCIVANQGEEENTYLVPALIGVFGCLASVVATFLSLARVDAEREKRASRNQRLRRRAR